MDRGRRVGSWPSAPVCLLLCALAPPVPTGSGGSLARYETSEPHMGTTFRIVLYASDPQVAARASRDAFARVAALDATLSDYREDSELSQLPRRAARRPVSVSDDLFRVIDAAQQLAEKSHGAFDITVGPYSRLWRRARRQIALPSEAELRQARSASGYRLLSVDRVRRTIAAAGQNMRLDAGGIAKGYAADAALSVLAAAGVRRALVAAGGDIAIGDPPPGRPGWHVVLAGLEPGRAAPGSPLLLAHRGVSTSGDAEQWVEIDGQRYSHIIDPRTGMALQGHHSVSVVAPRAMTSDMLATAVSVMGRDGLSLVERMSGCAVLLGTRTPAGDDWQHSHGWP